MEAGELGYALRRHGVTPKTLHLLIAIYAVSHQVPLLAADRDFQHMKQAGIALTVLSG